ncbi:hypothetical protein BU14_0303s0029 [Porphyra umbilicalis]|uniref:Uncharacterized protein n=1 Tax=Porphyra umbilicalis TaxID=2786 RepID=A0A1X6P006_PORUM|nr:hypothetical protein BU14_0303s0029 [Porphyra umbilicalis]|eukprot:OSX74198.1 hypothetical protein BU14_0303s0029 [Porphyra umbilicalis]
MPPHPYQLFPTPPTARPTGSLLPTLSARSLTAPPPTSAAAAGAATHPSLVRRLSVSASLAGHGGCVNRLAYDEGGTLLASASDDLSVGLWRVGDATLTAATRRRGGGGAGRGRGSSRGGGGGGGDGNGDAPARRRRRLGPSRVVAAAAAAVADGGGGGGGTAATSGARRAARAAAAWPRLALVPTAHTGNICGVRFRPGGGGC